MELKSKNALFAAWGCENPSDTYMYQIYYLVLKKIFPKLKTFDTKKDYFQSGKQEMNKNLLELVDKQNPELIIFALNYDELSLQTLARIKKAHPKTKLVIIICDDDARFDSWSRYIALFFDAVITSQHFLEEYKQDGINNVFYHWDYNTYKLEPMNLKKRYDITFIGRPKADRNEIFKYLLDKGIKLTLFGWEWNEYPEFKESYQGPLNQEDYAKVINQSKINLSPTKAGYSDQKKRFNMKGRFYEVALCKSFQLVEDSPGIHTLFKKNEVGLFTSNEDLVKKINYYLKHENEREEMAKKAYKKIINHYNREKQLAEIFEKIYKSNKSRKSLKQNKKVSILTKKDMTSRANEIKEKLKDKDYVGFDNGKCKISEYKNYLQATSLEKTKKSISCCDYYVSSFNLEEYLLFTPKVSFERIGGEANKLVNINQLLVKKEFFLENISVFQKLFNGKEVNLINEANTAFVSIPLVTVNELKTIAYEKMLKSFKMKFPDVLLFLMHRKRILIDSYPYMLALKSLSGNFFILRYLLENFFKQENKDKLILNKAYFENSIIKKFYKKKI